MQLMEVQAAIRPRGQWVPRQVAADCTLRLFGTAGQFLCQILNSLIFITNTADLAQLFLVVRHVRLPESNQPCWRLMVTLNSSILISAPFPSPTR